MQDDESIFQSFQLQFIHEFENDSFPKQSQFTYQLFPVLGSTEKTL